MEHLTKQQILLLTLFVSFVTSIATGIVTVSLYNQAPIGVTQTINQVIEKTVEKIIPNPNTSVVSSPTNSSQYQLSDAVDLVKKSIVKIKSKSTNKSIDGIGLIVSKEGVIVVDKSIVPAPGDVTVILPNGKEFPAQLIQVQSEGDIAFLFIVIPDTEKSKIDFVSITFASSIKLGQSVATLSLKETDVVSLGIIEKVGSDTSSTTPQVTSVSVSIQNTKSIIGSTLFNLSGEVIGLKTNSFIFEDSNIFYPLGLIKPAIPVFKK